MNVSEQLKDLGVKFKNKARSTIDGFTEKKEKTIKPILRKFIEVGKFEGSEKIDPKDVISNKRRLFSDTPENYAVYSESAKEREYKKGNKPRKFIRGALTKKEKREFIALYMDGRGNRLNQQKICTDLMNLQSILYSVAVAYKAIYYVPKGEFMSPEVNIEKIQNVKKDAQRGVRFEVPQATTGLTEYAKEYWSEVSDPEECARQGLAPKCANTNKGSVMASRERLKQMGCLNYTKSDRGFEPGIKQSETLIFDGDYERMLAIFAWLYSLVQKCLLPLHFGMLSIKIYQALVSKFFNCKSQIAEWMQETGKKIYEASFEIREVYAIAPPEPDPWVYD